MSTTYPTHSANGRSSGRAPQRPSDLMGAVFKGRGRNYLSLLACPVDGAPLTVTGDSVHCSTNPDHVYPMEDGILRLVPSEQRATFDQRSLEHETNRAAQGWKTPGEDDFKALPQTGLGGYPAGYWDGQAVGTALLWRFLEAIRLREGGLPVGPRGEAAVLGAGLGWLAYALDVAGYTTLAIDAHAGTQHGLGVYPIARYLRVQADPAQPPLAEGKLDLVVVQDGLAHLGDDGAQQAAFEAAISALKPGRWLVFMDAVAPTEDAVDAVSTLFEDAGLVLMAKPERRGWRSAVWELRDRLVGRPPEVPPVLVAQKPV